MSSHDNQDDNSQSANADSAHPERSEPAAVAEQTSAAGAEKSQPDNSGKEDWRQDVLNRLAFTALNDQRRARRWSNLFKAVTLVYVGIFLYMTYSTPNEWESAGKNEKHTALVELEGVISSSSVANADSIVGSLRQAFKQKNSVAVILRINSPGGSPVQAAYMYDEIKRLRQKYPEKKLYVVISDICASAGYYIAAAADQIYANRASLVGSIGVLMDGFGFVKGMEKLGIERRLLTAGEHKGLLDPFSPMEKSEKQHVLNMLEGVHQQFIKAVIDGRGDRLKKDAPGIFSGLFWHGEKGLELGLIDALGSASYVAREVIGADKIVDYTLRPNFFDRFAEKLGASIGREVTAKIGLDGASLR